MDYKEYEVALEKAHKENEVYLEIFLKWLEKQKLTDKTIRTHYSNVEFYINDYLNYYEIQEMKDGCYAVNDFLGDWFIRKAMWSNPTTVKSNGASLKKFYACMLEHGYIEGKDYQHLVQTIKNNMPIWIENVIEYNTFDEEDDFW